MRTFSHSFAALLFLFPAFTPAQDTDANLPVPLRNLSVSASFHPRTGDWISLRFIDAPEDNLIRIPGPAVDCLVDGRPLLGEGPRHARSVTPSRDGRALDIVYEKEGIRMVHHVEVGAGSPVVRQRVTVECLAGGPRKLSAVHYTLPSVVVGEPGDCLVQAPGQILPPDSPYLNCAAKPLDRTWSEPVPWYPQGWLECAPDQTSGLVAVENPTSGHIVSAWLYSDTATVFPTLDGRGRTLDIGHRHRIAAWLKPGVSVSSGTHMTLMTAGAWTDHLAQFRDQAYQDRFASNRRPPDWLVDARLLQIDPRPITAWTEKLDWIKSLRFNVVYCMPVWKNQGNMYALIDHYQLDQKSPTEDEAARWTGGHQEDLHANPFGVGTEDQLKMFVQEAHRRGIKVFFDFIPQGIGVLSPFAAEHPDWLVKDDLGRPFASHGWGPGPGQPAQSGTYSCDWGNPEYRDFAVRWAMWNVRTFGIDGFRMDAMHWKEPNFDPGISRPAYTTMFGGIRLIAELRRSLDVERPGFVLLSEVWGPIFQACSDGTYENGWLLKAVNEGWLRGRPVLTGSQWTRHLADAEEARPAPALRAVFFANHDIQDLVEMAKATDMGDAVNVVHALGGGIPFVWYRELDGREGFFRKLLKTRAALKGYRWSHRGCDADRQDVFTALWSRCGGPDVLVMVNLSYRAVQAVVRLDRSDWNRIERLMDSGAVDLKQAAGGLSVSLSAAGYAVVRLGE